MNIGDRVRLIHSKEEGVITKVRGGNYVEVDIGDGFAIPALTSELVLVSPVEKERMIKPAPITQSPQKAFSKSFQPFATTGLFISFIPQNDRETHLFLINNSDWKIMFTVFGNQNAITSPYAGGILEPKSYQLITTLKISEFESWPTFEINLLYFDRNQVPTNKSVKTAIRCRKQSFYNHKASTPLLNKTGHVYSLDTTYTPQEETPTVFPDQIRESLLGNSITAPATKPSKVEKVIDLHIEKLQANFASLSNQEIIAIQLKHFETQLENAIAWGVDELTFVHGVGQGVLRNEIHKRLSRHPNVSFYKDAQKEKFGYGATLAHFK